MHKASDGHRKTNMKNKILKNVLYLFVAVLVGVTAVYAGDLLPTGSPAKTMKSLADLHQLIDTGANTPSTDFATPTGDPTPTMFSLGATYDLLKNKITAIDGTKIATGTNIFGVDGSGNLATTPTFASTDATTYICENLTTDPTQPLVTLQTICGYNTGCTWTGSACTGGTKTPNGGMMTWYAGKASCSASTEGGQVAGTWRLPTYLELAGHYLDNNNAGSPPGGFTTGGYWSGSTYQYPDSRNYAYYVVMGGGGAYYVGKSNPNYLVHCAH